MDTTQGSDDGKVVVIGGGMGGMAVALQLRAKGHAVVLVEKNEHLGGIAAGFEKNGVHDFYPLGFGDYSAFESLFELHGKKAKGYVDVIHQEEMCTRFIDDDKESLDLGSLEFSLDSLKQKSDDHAPERGVFAPGRSLSDNARTWTLRENAASLAYPRRSARSGRGEVGGQDTQSDGRVVDRSRNLFEGEVQWRVGKRQEGLAAEGRREVAGASGLAVASLPPSS
jgi:glycine/D-amino acid oxidase-like deaminating enzyme